MEDDDLDYEEDPDYEPPVKPCPACRGRGVSPDLWSRCPVCGGEGTIENC